MSRRLIRKKRRRSPAVRAWQSVGLSLLIALLSVGVGVLVGGICKGFGDYLVGGHGAQWVDWCALALGAIFGLGTIAFSILEFVKSMKLKAWHLILGTILWLVAPVLGFWAFYHFVLMRMG